VEEGEQVFAQRSVFGAQRSVIAQRSEKNLVRSEVKS